MPQPGQESVVIIGGGFTGLTAACRLARAGRHQLTIIERSSSLGGLAGDFALQGTQLEKTYHHLFTTDSDILELAHELGLEDTVVLCDSSVGLFYAGKVYPFMSPRDILTFQPLHFFNRLRLGVVALYLQRTRDGRRLAGQPAHSWMRRACGRQVAQVVWGPLLRGKFHHYADSISMAWLWARIHSRGNSRDRAASEKLAYFRGGFAVVTNKLESELTQAGVTIRKNTKVDELKIHEGRPTLLLDGRKESFDRCVFTGPSPSFARLIATEAGLGLDSYRRKLESIEYLGAISLVFVSRQPIGDYYWLNISQGDAPFLVFIRHTKLVDKAWYNGHEVYYIGSYQPHDSPLFSMSEEAITDLWFGFLRKIYPQFDPAQVFEKHLFKLKYAQHIVDTAYQSKIPDCKTPLPGVYLSNFSQVFPEDRGTNFAVREGLRVAELILSEANP
ncbi:MAG: NAD(P)/FAD-dependent oxidoreductase [Verrucomicrobiota bacterium]|jgi:protoporphyrinogen oxidase